LDPNAYSLLKKSGASRGSLGSFSGITGKEKRTHIKAKTNIKKLKA